MSPGLARMKYPPFLRLVLLQTHGSAFCWFYKQSGYSVYINDSILFGMQSIASDKENAHQHHKESRRIDQLMVDLKREQDASRACAERCTVLTNQISQIEATLASTQEQLAEANSENRRNDLEQATTFNSPPAKRGRRTRASTSGTSNTVGQCLVIFTIAMMKYLLLYCYAILFDVFSGLRFLYWAQTADANAWDEFKWCQCHNCHVS